MMRRHSPGSGHRSDAGTPPLRQRVIVADDDVLLREGLVHLLTSSRFHVVGQAGDGGQLMDLVKDVGADLVVVDNRMPPTWTNEGLQTAREISQRFPSVGILVLSAFVAVNHALDLLCGGDRVGYLLKSHITDVAQLVDALEQISLGGTVIDPSLVRELVTDYRSEDPLARLSVDEHEVLELMAQGRSDIGIAEVLGMTEDEVGRHVHSVVTKLRLPKSATVHHRVLAVLAFLEAR
jgi:DNA-binding NarL/FixJ family response regulator